MELAPANHPRADQGLPLAASVRDPDEARCAAFMRIGRKMDVIIDGRVPTKVIGYNVLLGTVFRFRTDEAGAIRLTPARDDAETETLHGVVEARWRPGHGPQDAAA